MKPQKKTDQEICQFLRQKIERSMNDEDGDLSEERKEAFEYYNGELYGNERDGYSKIVTREVFEAVEWAKPQILRVFTSGERVVEFMAVGPEDEDQAAQETDVINHLLIKKNDGYMNIYNWITDALMNPVGYVKLMIEDVDTVISETYDSLNEAELMQVMSDEDIEVTGQDVQMHPELGALYTIKVRKTIQEKCMVWEVVPPEQALIEHEHRELNLDSAGFVCHRVQRDLTYLVEQGYDRDDLLECGGQDGYDWNDEKINRNYHEDEDISGSSDDDEAMREIWVHECYAKIDCEGTGLAERYKFVMIGDKLFEKEPIDYQPLIPLATIPIPHKHPAVPLAATVMDLQLVSSTLLRQLLDNIYKQNIRRKYVSEAAQMEDGSTMDALLDNQAEIIPVRRAGEIEPEQVQSIVSDILPVIQHIKEHVQTRTGVAPQLSMDPNVLQQSTAGAFMGALEQASHRIELYTRTMAETGFKWLMIKAHQLSRTYLQKELAIKLRGQWVTVNPSEWRDRTDVEVKVGLGFNDKTMKLQLLSALIDLQKEAMQIGMADAEKLYNTLTEMVECSGLSDVSQYFIDPKTAPPPQEPGPSIEEQALKAQQDIDGARIQNERGKIQAQADKDRMAHDLAMFNARTEAAQKERELDLRAREVNVKEQTAAIDGDDKRVKIAREQVEMESQDIENRAVALGVEEFANATGQN